MVQDPTRLISGILVRPEDLEVYEEIGIHRFKVSGRNKSTPWLLRAARAYAQRRYSGNLLDILSFVQVKAPLHFARDATARLGDGSPELRMLRDAYASLEHVSVDNEAFPKGFLRRIAATDCTHLSCSECGYCGSVARKVMRVNGRPLTDYAAPSVPGNPTELLHHIQTSVNPTVGPGSP
jgi:collagenase-like PrtC family protease